MKILITGGAGYIGSALCEALADIEKVTEIIIYDNLVRANFSVFLGKKLKQGHKIKFIHGDILDTRKLKAVIDNVNVVYHLAAKVSTPFANTDPHFFEQVNHWGTAELSYLIDESKVEKLIYLSSTSVYGASNNIKSVDHPLNPKTFYGISKMRGEEHMQRLSNKVQTYIFRCGNVYGFSRAMRFDAVINKFMFDAHFNKRISIHGDGNQKRAFIHLPDLIEILTKVLADRIAVGTYNAANQNLSINDIANTLKFIYPDLEFIFINQHMQLREIVIAMDEQLKKQANIFKRKALIFDDLKDFKAHFSF